MILKTNTILFGYIESIITYVNAFIKWPVEHKVFFHTTKDTIEVVVYLLSS